MPKTSLGAFIAAKRKALGKTQKDLASALGYTPQAISRLETSDGSLSVDLIPALCKFLNCSIDALYDRDLEGVPYDGFVIDVHALGDYFVEARKAAKLSQEEFAEALGISPKTLRKYEKNLQIPTFYVIERYCEFSGKKPSSLLAAPSPKPTPTKSSGFPKMVKALILGGAALAVVLGAGIPIGIALASRKDNHADFGGGSSSSSRIESSSLNSSSMPQSSSISSVSSEAISSIESSGESFSLSSEESTSENSSSVASSTTQSSSLSSDSSEEASSSDSSDESSSISSIESSSEETSSMDSSEESSSSSSFESSPEESSSEEPKIIISDRTDEDRGITLTLPAAKTTVTMGHFPQSVVTDEDIISGLTALQGADAEGTALSYDGNRYLVARSIVSFQSESGESVPAGLHYFRYDPIEWIHAADDDDGGHLFVTKNVLEIKPFTDHPVYKTGAGEELLPVYNNYEYSSVREYLNGDFFESAFDDEEKASILLTHVDNSLQTTIDNANVNLCNDTYDRIYLPSCNEMKLGGMDKSYRCASTSDYFKAMGGRYQMDDINAFGGNGYYWLRSPYNTRTATSYVRVCSPIGMIYVSYDDDDVVVNASYIGDAEAAQWESGPYGLRPAMRLSVIPPTDLSEDIMSLRTVENEF